MNDTYWFVFCKDSLLLERKEDGSYMIPCGPKSPVKIQPWTNILNVSPLKMAIRSRFLPSANPFRMTADAMKCAG